MKRRIVLYAVVCAVLCVCNSRLQAEDLKSDVAATSKDIETLKSKLAGQTGKDADSTKAALAQDYYKLGQQLTAYIASLKTSMTAETDANVKGALQAQIDAEQTILDGVPGQIAQYAAKLAAPAAKNTPWTRAVVGFNLGASTARTPQSQAMAEIFTTGPLIGRIHRKECPSDDDVKKINDAVAKALNDSKASPNPRADAERDFLIHAHPSALNESAADVELHFQSILQACANDPFRNLVWGWINPRISSLPSDTTYSLSSLSDPSTLLGLQNGKANQIAQTFEFTGGFDLQLARPKLADENDAAQPGRLGVYWTWSGGMSTPLVQNNASPTVYAVTPEARAFYAVDPEKSNIAFVPQDRSKFYLQYYTGLRLKTFFGKNGKLDTELFPGQFDILVGQNEAITGARLRGLVYRIEGFYPLPFAKYVHVFGLVLMHSRGAANLSSAPPLGAAQTSVTFADPSVFRVTVPAAPNSDFYRIGLGFDLLCLMQSSCRQNASGGSSH